VAIYPRLEARVALDGREEPDSQAALDLAPSGRATFDLPELDALLGGGLTRETGTLVVGSPGAGKTLLGLHFALAGVRAGEPALVLGFHETRRQLLLKAETFDLGPRLRAALAPGGGLTVLRRAPVELDPDVLADDLLAALDRTGARRLVVDSIAELERAVGEGADARRVPDYLAALVEALQTRGVTTLFTKETGSLAAAELDLTADLVSVIAANVIWLQQVIGGGRLHRVLSVPKMRYSAHDVTLREFVIAAPAGIEVLAPYESDRGALADIARRQDMPAPDAGETRGRGRSGGPDAPAQERS
jgi:circadian clock protein KaiC